MTFFSNSKKKVLQFCDIEHLFTYFLCLLVDIYVFSLKMCLITFWSFALKAFVITTTKWLVKFQQIAVVSNHDWNLFLGAPEWNLSWQAHSLSYFLKVYTYKVCPIENNTNLDSIFCLIKSSKIDLFFYLHFTWLCGPWDHQRILKK